MPSACVTTVRTEESYVMWIRRYILLHQEKHPPAMGADEVNAFLTHLARSRPVAKPGRKWKAATLATKQSRNGPSIVPPTGPELANG